MRIIIVGNGKVGSTFANQLSLAGHDVTIVDKRAGALQQSGSNLDIMTVVGNGATIDTLQGAGVSQADLLIATTSTDEMNVMVCLLAKKLGTKHTIARVRNPEFTKEINLLKEELGLSMTINPELACATEMARVLRVPSAIKVDSFAKGKVDILKLRICEKSPLAGLKLQDMRKFKASFLICAVERGKEVYIPDGAFQLEAGDRISILAQPKQASAFFKQIGVQTSPVKKVMLIGGGRIAAYLARQMLDFGAEVKIIEQDRNVCLGLADQLPGAEIICGDASDHQLLSQEGMEDMDAVAMLTGFDEQNVLMSLYAGQISKAKIITKVNRGSYEQIVDGMEIGSVFYPKYIAAEVVTRYVRAMENSMGSNNVETLYKIVGDRAEALEFRVTRSCRVCGIPLQELPTRKGILIGSITRGNRAIIPKGQNVIEPGDSVVVVTTIPGLSDLEDILQKRR